MGFRFRKNFKIAPGIKLNLSKSGLSASLGKRGATVNIGSKGVRETLGVPGSGMSYSEYQSYKGGKSNRPVLGFVMLAIIIAICAVEFLR